MLPSIKTDHLTPNDVPSLTEKVRSVMMSRLSESSDEISELKSNGSSISKQQVPWIL